MIHNRAQGSQSLPEEMLNEFLKYIERSRGGGMGVVVGGRMEVLGRVRYCKARGGDRHLESCIN